MDYRNLFPNQAAVDEFMDQLPNLVDTQSAGLEGLESLDSLNAIRQDAAATVRGMQEGVAGDVDPGLEAIIRRFKRPAYFVKDNSFDTANTPSTAAEVDAAVEGARHVIESAIPSVGRVNLRNHRKRWVGTGWVVAPNVVVTNRHVANEFAVADGETFSLEESAEGRRATPLLDMYREHGAPRESVFRMREVLWIEPKRAGHHDVAFLSIDEESEDDEPQPPPIALISDGDYESLPNAGAWVAVIGYPAQSQFNDPDDQARIFQGVFDVKRLQPGQLTAKGADGIVQHDATTLGGNSGSTVIDLASGAAVALHYGGLEGETNKAVAAPVIRRLMQDKL